MARWAEVLDWFRDFQQALKKKVAKEDSMQATPVAQAAPVAQQAQTATQSIGVVLKEKTMPQAAAQQAAVLVDEAAEQRKREGAALAQALMTYGVYKGDLASMLGASPCTISSWITGKTRIDYTRIAACRVMPQRLQRAVLAFNDNNTSATKTVRTKTCKICGKQFVSSRQNMVFCPLCILNNKKTYEVFFAMFPRTREVLQQRYLDLSSMLFHWASENSPAPCTKDLIAKECGEKTGLEFGRLFNCKNVCNGSKTTWCIRQKCKYYKYAPNKIPTGGTL